MKKVIIVALSIIALAGLTGVSYAEETAPVVKAEKPQVAAPKKDKHAKKQAAASQTDKQAADKPQTDAPQIGSKTDAVQGRGLPKAFSNSEGQ